MARTNGRLRERDRDILAHVARYRITVPEALTRLFFPENQPNAVVKVLGRLKRAGYLTQRDFYHPRKYWTLTPHAARTLGVQNDFKKPLGPDALPQVYGMLHFCCLTPASTRRDRITAIELRSEWPEYDVPPRRYYVEDDGSSTRLGYLHVDYAGSDYVRLVRKCREIEERRYDHEAFRELMESERFSLTVATAYEEKKRRLDAAFAEARLPVRPAVVIIPELSQLIGKRYAPQRRSDKRPD